MSPNDECSSASPARTPWIVVPTFAPDLCSIDNIRAMSRQAPLMVVDDGSPETSATTLEEISRIPDVTLVRLVANRGIATALNVGIAAAIAVGATDVVTFDQDSLPVSDHVERVIAVLACDPRAGVVGPGAVEGTTTARTVAGARGPVPVDELIQSGAGFRVSTYHSLGPLDEGLFIDGVDSDYCLQLSLPGCWCLLSPTWPCRTAWGTDRPARVECGLVPSPRWQRSTPQSATTT